MSEKSKTWIAEHKFKLWAAFGFAAFGILALKYPFFYILSTLYVVFFNFYFLERPSSLLLSLLIITLPPLFQKAFALPSLWIIAGTTLLQAAFWKKHSWAPLLLLLLFITSSTVATLETQFEFSNGLAMLLLETLFLGSFIAESRRHINWLALFLSSLLTAEAFWVLSFSPLPPLAVAVLLTWFYLWVLGRLEKELKINNDKEVAAAKV